MYSIFLLFLAAALGLAGSFCSSSAGLVPVEFAPGVVTWISPAILWFLLAIFALSAWVCEAAMLPRNGPAVVLRGALSVGLLVWLIGGLV
jgi:hypothetical protein